MTPREIAEEFFDPRKTHFGTSERKVDLLEALIARVRAEALEEAADIADEEAEAAFQSVFLDSGNPNQARLRCERISEKIRSLKPEAKKEGE